MSTTVQQLIEKLSTLDPNLVVKRRDTKIPTVLHDINVVTLEEFVDLKGHSAVEALRLLREESDDMNVQTVVAVG